MEELIAKEKEAISKDTDLRKKFAELEKLLMKNAQTRDFYDYLTNNEKLLHEIGVLHPIHSCASAVANPAEEKIETECPIH